MPPRKPQGPGVATDGEARHRQLSDFFKTSDASVEGVLDWDLKPDRLQAAILGMLSVGGGLAFGLTRDGSSVIVTVYFSEGKEKKYVEDAIELDEFMSKVIEVSRAIRGDMEERAGRKTQVGKD